MVFAVIMFAALLRAGWNAIVKSATDKFLTTGGGQRVLDE